MGARHLPAAGARHLPSASVHDTRSRATGTGSAIASVRAGHQVSSRGFYSAILRSRTTNQHAPLAPGAYTQRYLRLRDAPDPEAFRYEHFDEDGHPGGCVQERVAKAWQSALVERGFGDARGSWARSDSAQVSDDEVVEALAQRLELVDDETQHLALVEPVVAQLDPAEVRLLMGLDVWRLPPVLALHPFWVRPLRTWTRTDDDGGDALCSLIAHLFELFEIPRVLRATWTHIEMSAKWIAWTILFGRGVSLHRAASRFGWSVSGRFSHAFARAPHDLSPEEACVWAELWLAGCEDRALDALRTHQSWLHDPTGYLPRHPLARGYFDRQEDRFRQATLPDERAQWLEAVRWLVRQGPALAIDEQRLIVCWATHRALEAGRRPGARPVSWKGRGARAVLADARAYNLRLDAWVPQRGSSMTWAAHDLDLDLDDGRWSFVELTSTELLIAEGRALSHCVGGYGRQCAAGSTAIVSMRCSGVPTVTLEVDVITSRVRQARGTWNRHITAEEAGVVARWRDAISARRAAPAHTSDGRAP